MYWFDIKLNCLQNLNSNKLINIFKHIEYINILFIFTRTVLKPNLIKSTIGIINPENDTLLGPTRICVKLKIFRSKSVNHPDLNKINNKHINIFIIESSIINYYKIIS